MVVDHFPHENGKKRGNISGPKKAILDSKKTSSCASHWFVGSYWTINHTTGRTRRNIPTWNIYVYIYIYTYYIYIYIYVYILYIYILCDFPTIQSLNLQGITMSLTNYMRCGIATFLAVENVPFPTSLTMSSDNTVKSQPGP